MTTPRSPKSEGTIKSFFPEEKARVGKYACEHGVASALSHFKEMGLKETSIRDWRNAYQKIVNEKSKDAKVGEAIVIKMLPGKKRGRPPGLGRSLDEKLQEMIHSLRERQTAISSTVVAGLGQGLLLKHNKTLLNEYGGPLELNKSWAHSVLRQMGFTKRRATSKSKLTVDNFGEVKEQYLIDIRSVMKMENIPDPYLLIGIRQR